MGAPLPADDTTAVLACVRSIPTQRPAAEAATVTAARAWLWAHTAQPNGHPWDANPEHLEQAAADLAAALRTVA